MEGQSGSREVGWHGGKRNLRGENNLRNIVIVNSIELAHRLDFGNNTRTKIKGNS